MLKDLQQQIAINHGIGPAIVLAGPGSGKTYVLTHHIKHLIEDLSISPDNILVITFTKDATLNMKKRFAHIMPDKVSGITFGTFHSVFFSFLQMTEAYYRILDTKEKQRLITSIISDNESVEDVINSISRYKSLYSEDEKKAFFLNEPKIKSVYEEYVSYCNENGFIDYDDIILICMEKIISDERLCNSIKNKYQYVLIDEFQDINKLQYEIIRKILNPPYNLYVVGDDDQSIYGFRGSSGRIMKQFLWDYKDTSVISLKNNYRTHVDISKYSERLISKNTGRLRDYSQNCINRSLGEHFYLRTCTSLSDENDKFIKDITGLIGSNKRIAVLFRTNKEVKRYKNFLSNSLNNSDLEFENNIIEGCLCYIHFSIYKDKKSFLKMITLPERYINTSVFKDEYINIDKEINSCKQQRIKNELYILKNIIDTISSLPSLFAVLYLKNIVGLDKYFKTVYEGKKVEEVFEKIESIAKKTVDKEAFLKCFKDSEKNEKILPDNVTFLTFHASKGLEFDAVFIPHVVEGYIPGRNAVLTGGVEEERRLFYVAMTRAIDKLYIYTIMDETDYRFMPSRFIKDMCEN